MGTSSVQPESVYANASQTSMFLESNQFSFMGFVYGNGVCPSIIL